MALAGLFRRVHARVPAYSSTIDYTVSDDARAGDHRWWVSDLSELQADYPDFKVTHGIDDVLHEIHDVNAERWLADAAIR